ncbi:hypothetical protein QAD02_003166 [Eretmocerus hayati]|uniref:Uncharacterized protein n=1 Tax=Eretmocerus hayati TaxID=131215 RepID=A0ACC2NNU8_9HYME|nr:hypothetical protein QAD02_003166 [Eretmocerus hayati]
MGNDSDATDCDLADAISLLCTPESSDREDLRPLNFTIDISEGGPIQLDHDVHDVYLLSSPISALDPDGNDVGILRLRPCGRLATVLIRDFCEPVAAAWNAIRQREASWPEPLSDQNEVQPRSPGERNPITTESSGFEIHELQNSLPAETSSIPCTQPRESSHTENQRQPQESQPFDIAPNDSSPGALPSTQSGGSLGASASANDAASEDIDLQVRRAGVRFTVVDAGPRYVRRFRINRRLLALRILPSPQGTLNPISWLKNEILRRYSFFKGNERDVEQSGNVDPTVLENTGVRPITEESIVEDLPLAHANSARNLLMYWQNFEPDRFKWNAKGDVIIDGRLIPQSDISELLANVVSKGNKRGEIPTGQLEMTKFIGSSATPVNLVGNLGILENAKRLTDPLRKAPKRAPPSKEPMTPLNPKLRVFEPTVPSPPMT